MVCAGPLRLCAERECPDWERSLRVEVIGPIFNIEIIAAGHAIRTLRRLRREYGRGRWRKLKGIARVRVAVGDTVLAEVHWYEAAGVGRREFKIKRLLGE